MLPWPSHDVFLLPHIPLIGQGGNILLVLYSMMVLMACHFMICVAVAPITLLLTAESKLPEAEAKMLPTTLGN